MTTRAEWRVASAHDDQEDKVADGFAHDGEKEWRVASPLQSWPGLSRLSTPDRSCAEGRHKAGHDGEASVTRGSGYDHWGKVACTATDVLNPRIRRVSNL